jgi:hypothetical protein
MHLVLVNVLDISSRRRNTANGFEKFFKFFVSVHELVGTHIGLHHILFYWDDYGSNSRLKSPHCLIVRPVVIWFIITTYCTY